MKKIVKLFLVSLIALVLSSCGGDTASYKYLEIEDDLAYGTFAVSGITGVYVDDGSFEHFRVINRLSSIPSAVVDTLLMQKYIGPDFQSDNGNAQEASIYSTNDDYATNEYWFHQGFISVRRSDGWSNFNHILSTPAKQVSASLIETKNSTVNHGCGQNCTDTEFFSYYKYNRLLIKTPPAFLHLTLDSINDFRSTSLGGPGSLLIRRDSAKAWIVNQVIDANQIDVTNDPAWDCINDNVYTFDNAGKLIYNPGAKKCDIDSELDNLGLSKVYRNYIVSAEFPENKANPGKITLTMPGIPDNSLGLDDYVAEVIQSSFTEVVIRVTNDDGDSGDLYLIPKP